MSASASLSMNLKAATQAEGSLADSTVGRTDMMRSGFLPDRIVHLHPTRLCNLACLHCYSESAPKKVTALDPVSLLGALQLLKTEGYNLISFSGGEPLLYAPLRTVVEHAKAEGFQVTMITNGLLATDRMDDVLKLFDTIAVSFDGLAATHNWLRGRPDAFDRACSSLGRLANKGLSVAAAISLTRDAIPDLPELADLLVNLGAKALQVRPVARAGRARDMISTTFFTASDRARLYLVVLALQRELATRAEVHCDLAPEQGLWNQRDAYAALLSNCISVSETRPLADLVNPLVITETGTVKPIAYDFASCFDVASIETLSHDRLKYYKEHELANLRSLIGDALIQLQSGEGLVDWFDQCTRLSESSGPRGGGRFAGQDCKSRQFYTLRGATNHKGDLPCPRSS